MIQNSLFLGRAKASALTIPWCTYTEPEIAHVGLYENQARENGIAVDTPSYELLQGWLGRRPDGRLLQAWGEYMVALRSKLSPAEVHALRDEVIGRARAVAEAAGGFLGLGNKVSAEEEVVLQQLAKAFAD